MCLLDHISKSLNIKFLTQCSLPTQNYLRYCKIPKIKPGAYIFQRLFLRDLFMEGLAYLERLVQCTQSEICITKSIGLAYSWKTN